MHQAEAIVLEGTQRQFRADAYRQKHSIKRTSALIPHLVDIPRSNPGTQLLSRPTSPPETSLAVATVGSGGRIYLMPRRAPTAAARPPSSGSSALTSAPASIADHASLRTAPQTSETFLADIGETSRLDLDVPSLSSHSLTGSSGVSSTDPAEQHAIIQRRYSKHLSKQMDQGMLLQVSIPSHRMGVPSFTQRGSLFFHDSFLSEPSPSEKFSLTTQSSLALDDVFPAPPTGQAQAIIPDVLLPQPSMVMDDSTQSHEIGPGVFDELEAQNDLSSIQYGSSGAIVAATPARLIAHITHETFLDYELLSDFFLTYRCFLQPQTLLRYLIVRLEWAVSRQKAAGAVIRVRTFVAIRHWVLNYFLDDFEPDYALRQLFCDLVNDLAYRLSRRHDHGAGDLKVVGELKKCWRRTCDIVWETTLGARQYQPTDEIVPGGLPQHSAAVQSNNDSVHPGPLDKLVTRNAARESFVDPREIPLMAASPFGWKTSRDSLELTSCSLPMWRTIGQSIPSLRPRALLPLSQSDSRLGLPRALPARASRHTRSKSSKGSSCIRGADNASEKSGSLTPRECLGEFQSGNLIRGMLLAPTAPDFESPDLSSGEFPGAASADKEGNFHLLVDSMRKRLHVRESSPTKSRSSSRRGGSTVPPDVPEIVYTGSDALAAGVAETYTELIRQESRGDADRADTNQAAFEAPEAPWSRGAHLMPAFERMRKASHMTTSSRDIMIINDTDNTAFSKPFNLDEMAASKEDDIWSHRTQLKATGDAQNRLPTVEASPMPPQDVKWAVPKPLGLAFNLGRDSVVPPTPTLPLQHVPVYKNPFASTRPGAAAAMRRRSSHVTERSESVSQPRRPSSTPLPIQTMDEMNRTISQRRDIDLTLAQLEGRSGTVQTPAAEAESPLLQPTVYDPSQSAVGTSSRSEEYSTMASLDMGVGAFMDSMTSASFADSKTPQRPSTARAALTSQLPGQDERTSSEAPSSFLLDENQALSGDEVYDPWGHPPTASSHSTSRSRRRKGDARDESYFNNWDQVRASTPPTNFFPPPTTPPPSTPLPALPFGIPAFHNPIPRKAAERICSPEPILEHDPDAAPKLVIDTPPSSASPSLADSPRLDASAGLGIARPVTAQHTPFILAFSSEALAAQFTVIERDALSEIDWQDLVSARWADVPPRISNWAEYMRCPSQSGIDIVTTRFNLTVQWAVSEILLTPALHTRAATITKLIHIASHARHLRNFATAYQLTVALLSTAVQRLTRTWAEVPHAERASLASLERLVSPMRNFATLRAETDAALLAPGASGPFAARKAGACIPFLGIYTHDLAGVAQRPASVTHEGVEMVCFERFAATATAVKGLLGLLEASARYEITADKELVARCLWLGALSEMEIESRSRELR